MTRVWIYEDGKKLYGTIIQDNGDEYVIEWDDGEVTSEEIKQFNPSGWVKLKKEKK